MFSSQFGIDDAAGKRHEILITPILPNGDVLSEEELNAYIDESLNGAEDILKADTLGLVIAVDVDPDGTAGEALHLLQEKYYALKQDTEGNAASDARIRRALKVAEDTKNRELADLSGLLAKYRDFETQRAEIRRQGNEDIAALEEQRTEANSEQIDRAIAVARQKIEGGHPLGERRRGCEHLQRQRIPQAALRRLLVAVVRQAARADRTGEAAAGISERQGVCGGHHLHLRCRAEEYREESCGAG